jgi:hypothetical protein
VGGEGEEKKRKVRGCTMGNQTETAEEEHRARGMTWTAAVSLARSGRRTPMRVRRGVSRHQRGWIHSSTLEEEIAKEGAEKGETGEEEEEQVVASSRPLARGRVTHVRTFTGNGHSGAGSSRWARRPRATSVLAGY